MYQKTDNILFSFYDVTSLSFLSESDDMKLDLQAKSKVGEDFKNLNNVILNPANSMKSILTTAISNQTKGKVSTYFAREVWGWSGCHHIKNVIWSVENFIWKFLLIYKWNWQEHESPLEINSTFVVLSAFNWNTRMRSGRKKKTRDEGWRVFRRSQKIEIKNRK